uniref:Uncharacterized protein n=1 Tax=Trichogramma kaykai TaxID=54128 RepID=A0ABD2XE93_9HYME
MMPKRSTIKPRNEKFACLRRTQLLRDTATVKIERWWHVYNCGQHYRAKSKISKRLLNSIALIFCLTDLENRPSNDHKLLVLKTVKTKLERPSGVSSSIFALIASSCNVSSLSSQLKLWYQVFARKYLRSNRRLPTAENPLTAISIKLTNNQSLFYAGRSMNHRSADCLMQNVAFVDMASLLTKLKTYIGHYEQKTILHKSVKTANNLAALSTSQQKYIDKSIQCSKSTEFLKTSHNSKLDFRATVSLDCSIKKTSSKAALEHLVNGETNLARESSNPTASTKTNKLNRPVVLFHSESFKVRELTKELSSCLICISLSSTQPRLSMPNRDRSRFSLRSCPVGRRLHDRIQRGKEDSSKCCQSFGESRYGGLLARRHGDSASTPRLVAEGGVSTMKRALLQNYITEMKETMRSREAQKASELDQRRILDSVKKRIDEDIAADEDSARYLSTNEKDSYSTTARETPTSGCGCDAAKHDGSRKYCKHCCMKRNYQRLEKRLRRLQSRLSVHGDGNSTNTMHQRRTTQQRKLASTMSSSEELYASSNSGKDEELLCRRVESAVRKFTDELIVCERRAKDRSSSVGRRVRRRRPTSKRSGRDQRQRVFEDFRSPCYSASDRERIVAISTPSLVSLTDFYESNASLGSSTHRSWDR